eukprot:CAMPEP_0170904424 /NCGR_PEP_ID=MMETSP0734-20130129/50434_1 /TAXON_ID=186038 /ORGANISM="Fragilariopsis kerguelensis, Strain L26-C5" /LENGTH=114 /DNA_ID=CAMNT_0011299959 /DNA_START=52 /DNA_END=395 /DNA_ORIENTATION=-
MAMGWWKPHFFLDPTGGAIPPTDTRYTAHASRGSSNSSNSSENYSVYISALYYTIQKFTSGLLMLIMMSFNAVLFLEVVFFSGAAELWMKLRRKQREQDHVHSVPAWELVMEDC